GWVRIHSDDDLCPVRIAITESCVILTDSVDSTINGIEVHCRVHVGKRRTVLQVQLDRLIAQLVDEIGSPVPLQAWRIEGVEHAFENRVGHWPNKVQGRRAKPTNGSKRLLRLLKWPGVTPHDPTHLLIM